MLTLYFKSIAMLLIAVSAYAERPLAPRDRVYTLGVETAYFNSSANYLTSGEARDLAPGASFQNAEGEINAAYEMGKQWRFWTALGVGHSESNDGVVSRTHTGLNDLRLGSQYWFKVPYFFIVPQVQASYPLWRVDEASNAPLLGDGSALAEAGGWAIWRLKILQPFAYGGYAYRDSGRSALLKYSIGAYTRPGRWWILAAYQGLTSVSHDSDDQNRALRDVFLNRVDGGSSHFASVNPTLNEGLLQFGYYLGRGFKVNGSYAMTVNGNDAAQGWTATAGFSYSARLKVRAPERLDDRDQDGDQDSSDFKPQSEKYDESLFRDEKSGAKVLKRVRKTPSVDKLLNETQKQLEPKDSEDDGDN